MSAPDENISVHDRWVDTAGGRLFSRSWSPDRSDCAAPVILLHDSLGCVDLWRSFPQALCAATGRQVVAYDRLGFGKSDAHPGKLALDFIEAEAGAGFAAVKEALGIDRFVVFGHSVGGGMAVSCAARFREACAALITESAQAFVEDRTLRGIQEAARLFKDPDQRHRLRRYHGEKTQWVIDAWIGSWLDPRFAGWSLRPALPSVQCTTLVIHGAEDEYGSQQHPKMIEELAGGDVRMEIMPGIRHVPHREKEAEVVSELEDFLRSVP